MSHSSFRFEVKDVSRRQFSGYAAAYDVDLGGDVITKGAFARTLAEWKNEGHVIPLLDQHTRPITVASSIGHLVKAEETDQGLFATFQLLDGAEGVKYARRIKGGVVRALSIGYRAVKSRPPAGAEAKAGVRRVLEDVDLEEVSLVLRPMNPRAVIDPRTIKSEIGMMDDEQRMELKSWLEEQLKEAPPARQAVSESVADAMEAEREEKLRQINLTLLSISGSY